MPFDSLRYALFLPVVTAGYFACPPRLRWLFVVVASYFFYTRWDVGFAGVLVASTVVMYLVGRLHRSDPRRRYLLWAGIAANLTILITFKYSGLGGGVLVPIGISFFTLQAIGYLFDLLRGEREAELHLGRFAAYMAFFPHIVAGPIGRSTHLLPQFEQAHGASYDRLSAGMRQILWGLFQKVVIADNLGVFVDSVYGDVHIYSGFPLIFATLFFSFQLYADFAGYSNMALGSARLMGFDLIPNFDRPYLAQSLAEFWRRWHISLSTWLGDNVHKPLSVALRDTPKSGLVIAVVTTFALCGLWHGGTWNFLVWGLMHGVGLSVLALTARRRRKIERVVPAGLYAFLGVLATFFFVCFTWVFFRANSLDDAVHVVRNLGAIDFGTLIGVPTVSRATFVKELVLILVAILGDFLTPRIDRVTSWLGPSVTNYACIVILGFSIYAFGIFEKQVFIYAQF